MEEKEKTSGVCSDPLGPCRGPARQLASEGSASEHLLKGMEAYVPENRTSYRKEQL